MVAIYSAYSSDIAKVAAEDAIDDKADEAPNYSSVVLLTLNVALLSKALGVGILGALSMVASSIYIWFYWGYMWFLSSVVIWLGTFLFIRTMDDTPQSTLLRRLRQAL